MINVIFDIDGTLPESYDFDSELYTQAVRETLGNVQILENWGMYTHVTDSGILSQILEENKVCMPEIVAEQVRKRFGELIGDYLATTKIFPKKGAVEMMATLTGSNDYKCGIATGGWIHTATMKLKSVGMSLSGIPICACDNPVRIEIMKRCLNKLGAESESVVYVGDASWDMDASKELGWGFVGVGESLKGIAETWILDFTDPFWKFALNKALQRTSR
jgi:phosphoglycolate phosphatase-like HAD superfamily hydrolase